MSIIHRLRIHALVAGAAALSVAVIPAAALAKPRLVHIDRCASIWADKPVARQRAETSELAMNCLINKARAAAHVPPLKLESKHAPNGAGVYRTPLFISATGHAEASVAGKWWDPDPSHADGWKLSHMEPGNPAPYNEQITQRILGAGFCPGGTYTVAENTFSSSGMAQKYPPTPRGAVDWWLDEPNHHAVLVDPHLKVHRIGIVAGSAFPDPQYPPSGTFVEDLGSCS